MRKAMWLFIALFGLFVVSPTAVPATDGVCIPLDDNGKLDQTLPCAGGGFVNVKALSSDTAACAEFVCGGSSLTVVLVGCTASITLDAEGDAHSKAACKNEALTKVEITANDCVAPILCPE